MRKMLYSDIMNLLVNKKYANGQVVAACPICEKGDKNGHHLYIKVEDNGTFTCFCQKCNSDFVSYIDEFKNLGAIATGEEVNVVDNKEEEVEEKYTNAMSKLKKKKAQEKKEKTPKGEIIEFRTHIYKLPNGEVQFTKNGVKYENGDKEFKFQRIDENGKTVYNMPENAVRMYNLDLLNNADSTEVLYIVEGEKCADIMVKNGLLATSSSTGSKDTIKFTENDIAMLSKFNKIVVIPDNDEVGKKYVKAFEQFKVKELNITEFYKEAKRKDDVVDYFENGGEVSGIIESTNKLFPKFKEIDFNTITKEDILSNELLENIYNITDENKRNDLLNTIKILAIEKGCSEEYKEHIKIFINNIISKNNKKEENKTNFILLNNSPANLKCGDFKANDFGIFIQDKEGEEVEVCSTPITIVERMVNVENYTEKVKLAFLKDGEWQYRIYGTDIIASSTKILLLAKDGIPVNSVNCKQIIKYLNIILEHNKQELYSKKSMGHLGWYKDDFLPYDINNISYDSSNIENDKLISSFTQKGKLELWAKNIAKFRKDNVPVKLMVASSFASVLVNRLNLLPFIVHLYGNTEFGKTVSLMLGASVWGNPKQGRLVRSMNGTINSIMTVNAVLHDLPMFADELQTIKNRYDNYDELIMQVCEGVNRGRLNSDSTLKNTESWSNVFISTGEEPITCNDSGGGAKNRVLEIEVNDKLFKSGKTVADFVLNNYGTAGRKFIEILKNIDIEELNNKYCTILKEVKHNTEATDKQAMAIAVVLVAEEIISTEIFKDDKLTIQDIKQYLKTKMEVSASERAFTQITGYFAENSIRFDIDIDTNKGAIWGKFGVVSDIDIASGKYKLFVIKTVLERELNKMGFSYNAIKKDWADKQYQIKYGTKYSRSESINGTKVECITLLIEK